MAVDVRTATTFKAGTPKMLFELIGDIRGFDVTPDGRRFLLIKSVEQEQTRTQINLVLNWFEELKQKVPVK